MLSFLYAEHRVFTVMLFAGNTWLYWGWCTLAIFWWKWQRKWQWPYWTWTIRHKAPASIGINLMLKMHSHDITTSSTTIKTCYKITCSASCMLSIVFLLLCWVSVFGERSALLRLMYTIDFLVKMLAKVTVALFDLDDKKQIRFFLFVSHHQIYSRLQQLFKNICHIWKIWRGYGYEACPLYRGRRENV